MSIIKKITVPLKDIDFGKLQDEYSKINGFIGFSSTADDVTKVAHLELHFKDEVVDAIPNNTVLEKVITDHDPTPKPVALVYNHMSISIDPKTFDFTLLGLNQLNWTVQRGRRTERLYLDKQGRIVVRDKYVYSGYEKGVRSYTRTVEWLYPDQTVAFSKVIKEDSSYGSISKLNRHIRRAQIDYLFDTGEELRDLAETLPEPHKTGFITVANGIDRLFIHYERQLRKYISRGIGFREAIINEADPEIIAILDIQVPKGNSGEYWTVRDSVLAQITLPGIDPEAK